ncbi:proline-rich receptor-like protein kinase PERK8 [Primulina eburnea]|uniref:proline-rich receptor-like protein kinase PERK8 n=1 Tax=Primulina eburnea TaxID=1245227 RepID=UPI003C6C442E
MFCGISLFVPVILSSFLESFKLLGKTENIKLRVAVGYAKKQHAILPGQLKEEVKYFTENLACGISEIRQDKNIEIIKPLQQVTEFGMSSSGTGQETNSNQENWNLPSDTFPGSACSLCINRTWIGQKRQFTCMELHSATKEFSQNNLLSDHGRKLYKGVLNDQSNVLIWEQPSVSIKEEEFEREVKSLGKDNKGCWSMNVCNGSLNWHLSNKSRDLTWERRMSIARGAAKGLERLHRESIYGSVRPSNILLTHDYKALLSCYGLAMNKYKDLRQSSESLVLKTFEHLAPEYGKSGIDLSKADVFSFGVVLLELITGRKSLEDTDGESFLRWGRPLLRQKKYKELIDPMLQDSVDVFQLYWMVHVIDKCLSWDPNNRHSIKR